MKRVQKMLAVCPVRIATLACVAASQTPSTVSSEPLSRDVPVIHRACHVPTCPSHRSDFQEHGCSWADPCRKKGTCLIEGDVVDTAHVQVHGLVEAHVGQRGGADLQKRKAYHQRIPNMEVVYLLHLFWRVSVLTERCIVSGMACSPASRSLNDDSTDATIACTGRISICRLQGKVQRSLQRKSGVLGYDSAGVIQEQGLWRTHVR